MAKQGSSRSRRAGRLTGSSRKSRGPRKKHTDYVSAEKYLAESSGLSEREQQLILQYVRLTFDAVRSDPALWAALREGEFGADAIATALAILVGLTDEQPSGEPV